MSQIETVHAPRRPFQKNLDGSRRKLSPPGALLRTARDKRDCACSRIAPEKTRIFAGGTTKGLQQHAIEEQLANVAKLLNADRHALVTGCRLILIRSEQAIPECQIETKIAVGLLRQNRMVNSMHI